MEKLKKTTITNHRYQNQWIHFSLNLEMWEVPPPYFIRVLSPFLLRKGKHLGTQNKIQYKKKKKSALEFSTRPEGVCPVSDTF